MTHVPLWIQIKLSLHAHRAIPHPLFGNTGPIRENETVKRINELFFAGHSYTLAELWRMISGDLEYIGSVPTNVALGLVFHNSVSPYGTVA